MWEVPSSQNALNFVSGAWVISKSRVKAISYGSTSTLGFHSGMLFAGVWKSPVIFLCQNNGYAISLPAHEQTASEDYAIKGKAYGVPAIKVDGNDLFAVREAVAEAAERARAGEGPTLIEAVTFRMGGHSTSDDPTVYVPKEEVDEWKQKDPIDRFERYLKAKGLLDEDAGIFAVGVPLKGGLEAACRRVSAQHQGQAPMPVGLHNIQEDWCLCPGTSPG